MKITLFPYFLLLPVMLHCQQHTISFTSSDTALQRAFNWAKATAMNYRGDTADAVGPWYEAALPSRNAFCIRDAAHQSVAAELLGMHKENRNMFGKFFAAIAASRDWCSYWEIDKWNRPAPVDYQNDSAFWYNLNANFELLYTAERLYRWTGDTYYIHHPGILHFFEKTLHEYIRAWKLQPDSLLTRDPLPNKRSNYQVHNNYTGYRGIPSYVESVDGLRMSVDLVAAICRGFYSYAFVLQKNGCEKNRRQYKQLAAMYRQHINSKWWDTATKSYRAYLLENGKSGPGEGVLFLLWYDVAGDSVQKTAVVNQLESESLNVESMSYLPFLLYKNGYDILARKYLLHLSDPATSRREYPEVSFGVIDGLIRGLMGIEADAASNTIRSYYKEEKQVNVKVDDMPALGSVFSISHSGPQCSVFVNKGLVPVKWQACFGGRHSLIEVNGKAIKPATGVGNGGRLYSFVTVTVKPGAAITAIVK